MYFLKAILGLLLLCLTAATAVAEVQKNTRYRATIWVDPDGCQHWVIDTGLEGFMSQRLDRAGKPVCNAPVPVDCSLPWYGEANSDGIGPESQSVGPAVDGMCR